LSALLWNGSELLVNVRKNPVREAQAISQFSLLFQTCTADARRRRSRISPGHDRRIETGASRVAGTGTSQHFEMPVTVRHSDPCCSGTTAAAGHRGGDGKPEDKIRREVSTSTGRL
jgi:hypothetical protein